MLQKLIHLYCRLLGGLMVAALAIMVVLVFGNVVLRYAFNTGFTISEELSRWLFVWMTFLGAIVAIEERAHLGSDTLVSRLGVRGKKICLGLSYVVMLYLCWLTFTGAWAQARINLESTSAVMEVSMAWFFAAGVLFSASAGLMLLRQFWRLLSGQTTDAELVGFQENEEAPHADASARH